MARNPLGTDPVRNTRILELCRAGLTLQQVGDQYNLSRERVRQIARRAGLDAGERGNAVRISTRTRARSEQRKAKRDHWAQSLYGCDYTTLIAINGTPRTKMIGCLAAAYVDQKRNARKRGIPFSLTLPQWKQIWDSSGHLDERGRGRGRYVMSRRGDSGAYEIGNVFIQLATENVSDSRRRTLAKKHTPWQKKAA